MKVVCVKSTTSYRYIAIRHKYMAYVRPNNCKKMSIIADQRILSNVNDIHENSYICR